MLSPIWLHGAHRGVPTVVVTFLLGESPMALAQFPEQRQDQVTALRQHEAPDRQAPCAPQSNQWCAPAFWRRVPTSPPRQATRRTCHGMAPSFLRFRQEERIRCNRMEIISKGFGWDGRPEFW